MVRKYQALRVAGTFFYSAGDEDAFFGWLQRIGCVGEVRGLGRELLIPLTREPDDDELRELIALFNRYGADLRQLAQFKSKRNSAWFADPTKFWHEQVLR